jgi:hypothetical protein
MFRHRTRPPSSPSAARLKATAGHLITRTSSVPKLESGTNAARAVLSRGPLRAGPSPSPRPRGPFRRSLCAVGGPRLLPGAFFFWRNRLFQNYVIYKGLSKVAPGRFAADVGAEVPPVTDLYMLPDHIVATNPEAQAYKFTEVDDQVVLIDPTCDRCDWTKGQGLVSPRSGWLSQ